eukprot:gnl/MRDRNA2_/MRDRNA2_65542_c0_seq2.p1 gnl/MRDRNA2_/MRDRNA2_65542_c0~~gnl/MRDRNA2_/MRDRNA2_65542_c0_seq2.p1  ORF type:complete len:390 (+),score=39.52 gnl/MRDRNA2_/MRDRNA2_65542_c0_seq2:25-1170(+)
MPTHLAGQGLKLEDHEVDATNSHRAFHIRLGTKDQAIEVALAPDGGCVVVWGHHTLGFMLDNWHGKCDIGTNCHFSNWSVDSAHCWQLNENDMTISPRGKRHVVLGWGSRCVHGAFARLVGQHDPERICFRRNEPLTAPSPLRLSLDGRLRGQGIVLEHHHVDATHTHKAMHACLGSTEQTIDVEIDRSGHVVVVGGHSTLGYALDDWYMRKNPGTRCHFSNWIGSTYPHVFQLNGDMTISPLGHPQLVLGFGSKIHGAHLNLVRPDSPERIAFIKPRTATPAEAQPLPDEDNPNLTEPSRNGMSWDLANALMDVPEAFVSHLSSIGVKELNVYVALHDTAEQHRQFWTKLIEEKKVMPEGESLVAVAKAVAAWKRASRLV